MRIHEDAVTSRMRTDGACSETVALRTERKSIVLWHENQTRPVDSGRLKGDPGGVFHLADTRLVHHPFLAGVSQQVGQGLGVAVGLLDQVSDEQRRGFDQGAGLLEVGSDQ